MGILRVDLGSCCLSFPCLRGPQPGIAHGWQKHPNYSGVRDCGLLLGRLQRGKMMVFFFLCHVHLGQMRSCFQMGEQRRANCPGLAGMLRNNSSWHPYCSVGLMNVLDIMKPCISIWQSPLRCIWDTWSVPLLFRREMLHDHSVTRRYSGCSLSCLLTEQYRRKTGPGEP